ncbi:MAG TPA: DUF72 domain-containing protein [Steroidobacteraceae bacterium]|nr:DUF72 domain-containing protein [Steroidobacteraceae bacterium]
MAQIYVGIGGWDYDPWRETFYPTDVPQRAQLHYASRKLTAIEVNGTFYRLQSPAVFAKWRDETPSGFVFSLKASRLTTNRRDLREAGESVKKFLSSGITALGEKLGPILWQLAASKKFDAEEIAAFLRLLPDEQDGIALRHALEVRHASFMCPEYLTVARKQGAATVFADSDEYPSFADVTGDFVYMRLMKTVSTQPTGYTKPALSKWAQRISKWSAGSAPTDLPHIEKQPLKAKPRDVFAFFISGAKERAPAAAMRLIDTIRESS